MSYRQIADATKLSARIVEALETCRFNVLPAGIYRRAIVRAVANEVGLDPEALLAEYTTAFPAELAAPTINPPQPLADTRQAQTRPRWIAALGIAGPAVSAMIYLAWPGAQLEGPQPPALTAKKATHAEVVPAGGFGDSAATEVRPVTVTLTASSRCRLRVVSDGRELVGRWVEAGERLPIELGDEIVLSGDNASAIQLSINGQAGRQLGAPGETLSVRIGRDDYQSFLTRY